jgi:voltage-gated potassium channel
MRDSLAASDPAPIAAPASERNAGPYQLFILGLSLFVLLTMAMRLVTALSPDTRTILDYADLGVCVVFLGDFVVCLVRAPDRWSYLIRWGWIDLASSIPVVDQLRWGRAARVLRVFRVLRGVRASKILSTFILQRRSESAFLAVALLSIVLVVLGSIAVLHFEDSADANIKSAEDALWWAIVTITTVGYGDKFPISTEGRLVAVGLMVAGVGLFGTFTGFVASWFLEAPAAKQTTELDEIRAELAGIRQILEGQRRRGGDADGVA